MIERCENFERYPVQTLEGWCHATDEPSHCGGEHPLCRHLASFFATDPIEFRISDENLARMEEEDQEYRWPLKQGSKGETGG